MKKKKEELEEDVDLSEALGLINEDTILSPELYLHLSIIYAIRATSYFQSYLSLISTLQSGATNTTKMRSFNPTLV